MLDKKVLHTFIPFKSCLAFYFYSKAWQKMCVSKLHFKVTKGLWFERIALSLKRRNKAKIFAKMLPSDVIFCSCL